MIKTAIRELDLLTLREIYVHAGFFLAFLCSRNSFYTTVLILALVAE